MDPRDPDAGLALADDECFCDTPTIATNEHGETWCSVCGERLLLDDPPYCGECGVSHDPVCDDGMILIAGVLYDVETGEEAEQP